MNAQKGLMVVLGLGALAGIGYVVASSGKDTTAPPPPPPPVDTGPLPTYVPQALIEAYQQCFNMGSSCPAITYQQIQAGLTELMRAHPEEGPLWTYFSNELARVYGTGNTSSSSTYSSQSPGIANLDFSKSLDLGTIPLPLPPDFPSTLAVSYTSCWYQRCSQTEFDTLITGMQKYINQLKASPIRTTITDSYIAMVIAAETAIFSQRSRQTQGVVTGRHTGGCACQARQEEVGTGACCDSCAKGEECEECGNHAPAVG